MLYELKGEVLSVAVNSLGAELWRLEKNDEPERPLLWSGDPAVWPGRAPLLFPWCGAMEDGWFQVNEKRYAAPRKHGFARDMEHTLQARTKHSLTFRLDWLEDRERFPWSCSLTSRFSLEGQRLTVDCTTINNSRTSMPVQMGFHPAFRCPYTPGKIREDYIIRFEKPEAGCPDGIFALEYNSFSHDCVYFPKLRSDWIQLEEKDTGSSLRVDTTNWPYAVLWSMPGVPGFVCIEPWSGSEGGGHDLAQRPGAIQLEPGERRSWTLGIQVML